MIISEFYLSDINDSKKLAAKLAGILETGDIVTFEGTLGAGKTEFCRALIHASGFNEDVPSPTFSLLQTYEPSIDDLDGSAIWHFDLYRLENPEDVFELGIEDGFDTAITLIEWPDKMGTYLPEEHLKISISLTDEMGARNIKFEGNEYWKLRLKDLSL
ncbi:tRNA (adenosine(37)-N6)-threonylcarbamoyltransferase complex ATPase subunit type 1 TsaE [Pseudemcibacter aquimaris]|uniref:tRNA (adenosine(37)-N6)-threonylcarbamoyltransferase complex ATPase subunit type 1 TsaE n=1 Tax=Pseudemcibacter aquimaris TaxID=2857064 RepID=UPI002013B713|nr:tRNA (adenosine(37)-N6)-threonylcarbamoyltransferase complex ATPase subunit type 1 TsaE [Pseudemcibacter aquimaris]MCC3860271.1 tRNA (adenosine(37)-N6)-threonylcarbamoyltransferase complex ATPase subunit type 1 TsaE [Pseudemcibacter aquimaris]WDU57596.1 tRNA (adenosine(37)-N6)-threonylcarbamoyltransferase complex ATPase subunit type 1 TsaE [Pseudemcibacter aquimaris]